MWLNWLSILGFSLENTPLLLVAKTIVLVLSLSVNDGYNWFLKMTCGDNKQLSKSKVKGKNTKQEESKHGPLKN